MSETYKQCRISRNFRQQVAWIPERGAIKGAVIELKEDGLLWTVDVVHDIVLSEDKLREKQKMDRGSLPSVKQKPNGR